METSTRWKQRELLKTQLEPTNCTAEVSERLRRDAVIHLIRRGHIFTPGSCDVSEIEASNKLAEGDLKEMLRYREIIISVGKKCVLTFCCQIHDGCVACDHVSRRSVTLGSCWQFFLLAVVS